MIQEIITYLIIASAFGILLYNILQFFNLFGRRSRTWENVEDARVQVVKSENFNS